MDLLKVSLLHGLYGRWKKHKGQMHHPLVAYFHLGSNEHFGRNSQLGTVQEQRIICCELICNSNTQRSSLCIVECFDCYLGTGFLLLKLFWFVCRCVVFFSPVCVGGGVRIRTAYSVILFLHRVLQFLFFFFQIQGSVVSLGLSRTQNLPALDSKCWDQRRVPFPIPQLHQFFMQAEFNKKCMQKLVQCMPGTEYDLCRVKK